MKMNEIRKLKKREKKEVNVVEAKNYIHIAESLLQKLKFDEAKEMLITALNLSKDKDPETEAIAHFKIGKLIF
jgi:ATP sulfurylase